MKANNQYLRRTIEQAITDLPPIPRVAQSIIQQSNNPESSVQDLEKLIKADQAITAKLLRVVNSPYYGLPGTVTNIGQACLLLGVQQIRALVLGMTLFASLPLNTKKQQEAMDKFWLHSLTSVACANAIGQKRRLSSLDLGFVQICALLHDMGRLLLFTAMPQLYDQSMAKVMKSKESIAVVEFGLWGLTHAEIGQRMAEVWQLPTRICKVIGEHEGPFSDSTEWEAYPVHIADRFTQFIYGDIEEPYFVTADEMSLKWLAYKPEDLVALGENCLEKLTAFRENDAKQAA